MTKQNLMDIRNALTDPDLIAIIDKELNRGADAKAATMALYDNARDAVLNVLRGTYTPVTATEIFESCSADLPEGFTRAKITYGLTHYWQDMVVKIDGKVNTYRLRNPGE